MSTIKRLWNVGKGKVAVARAADRSVADESAAAPSEWVGAARHALADAAEAVAHAVRPEDAAARAEPPVERASAAPPPVAPVDPVAPSPEPPRPSGPRKRTL